MPFVKEGYVRGRIIDEMWQLRLKAITEDSQALKNVPIRNLASGRPRLWV